MNEVFTFTPEEKEQTLLILERLRNAIGETFTQEDETHLREDIHHAFENHQIRRDVFGLNPILHALQTAEIAVNEIGLKRDGVISILMQTSVIDGYQTLADIKRKYGDNVEHIIGGLLRIHDLYKRNPIIESENFRNLLISFSEDMRVILIMIADRVNVMRQIRDTKQEEAKKEVSEEASYLYAPLAHKLGLYKLKSELEDLSLKYLEHDAYYLIKEKLNATKASRDAYIARFIKPIQEKLNEAGLKYHMKGRTKSIHSIWQKMKKQGCGFEGVYDLFAIRIILDVPREMEYKQCWQVFAIITDMYQPIRSVCATGYPYLRVMDMKVCTPPYWVRKRNGWKSKSEQNVWTISPSMVWLPTGAIKVSDREKAALTNGLPISEVHWRIMTICN